MFINTFMLAIIFIVTLYMNALNIKAVLTVTRSITDPQLFYVNDFHTVLIPVDLCLTLPYISDIFYTYEYIRYTYIYIYTIYLQLYNHTYEDTQYNDDDNNTNNYYIFPD